MAAEIRVPRLGWSMEEGTFLGWKKREGEVVAIGEILYELEGEKATQEIESLDAGVLRIAPDAPAAGSVVPVGALLGCIAAVGEEVTWNAPAAASAESLSTRAPGAAAPSAPPSVRRLARELGVSIDEVLTSRQAVRITRQEIQITARREAVTALKQPPISPAEAKASPRARRAARQRGVDWQTLVGSGKGGRIRERDVLAAVAPIATTGAEEFLPITARRRTIAERMLRSMERTAPVTLTMRIDATELVELRSRLKSASAVLAVPTYTDLVARHAAAVLERHPLLAARWEQDRFVVPAPGHFDIGFAVDTEEGLLVPVLRRVGSLSVQELAHQSRELAERARSGKLTFAEMQGAVFTITNLGAYGIDAFTPIIDWPQTAVLGLGAIRREPTFGEGDRVVPRHFMTLSLTFDHRVIDGAPAARFLADLRSAIEQPLR